jgi:hypothetical protein
LSAIAGALGNTSNINVAGGVLSAVDFNSSANMTVAAGATANFSGNGLSVVSSSIYNSGNVNFTGSGLISTGTLAGTDTGTTYFSSSASISNIYR